MRIGFVWLPHIAVQVAILQDPSLRGRPLVVGDSADPSGRVVDASAEAGAAGVAPGMRLPAARELIPAAAVHIADPTAMADIVERALSLLERFSEVIEPSESGGAYLHPVIPGPGLANERRVGAIIVDALAAALGLSARIAIAPGMFVARVAAPHHAVATVTIIPDGEAAAFLAPLPVGELGLAPRAIERLGITTIGAFAALPPDSLPRRFGPASAPGGSNATHDLRADARRPADPRARRACRPSGARSARSEPSPCWRTGAGLSNAATCASRPTIPGGPSRSSTG